MFERKESIPEKRFSFLTLADTVFPHQVLYYELKHSYGNRFLLCFTIWDKSVNHIIRAIFERILSNALYSLSQKSFFNIPSSQRHPVYFAKSSGNVEGKSLTSL